MHVTQRLPFILFAVIAPTEVRPQPPADFDFRVRYGLCSTTDELDTFTGWFTRQLPDGNTVMAQLSLNVSQRQYLYEKVETINFFNYPSDFRGEPRQPPVVTNRIPFPTYQMDVRSNGRMHSVRWDDDAAAIDPRSDGLRRLFGWAVAFINDAQEVKQLPPAAKLCGRDNESLEARGGSSYVLPAAAQLLHCVNRWGGTRSFPPCMPLD